MKVLVTGANGLLGHHVVMELIARGQGVSVIVRNTRNLCFDCSKVNIHIGDFTLYDDLKTAATGCEAIIHIAAITDAGLRRYEDYSRVNVEGTKLVLRVADELGINRIVYVSSANTVGFGTALKPGEEYLPIQFPFTGSFYAWSKAASEQLMTEASQQPDRHVIILNPTFLIGAYDTRPSSGRMMLMGYKRSLMVVPKGGKNFVAARDVAVSTVNALSMGNNGERYLLAGTGLSFKEFYSIQKTVANYKQYLVEMPGFLLLLLGKIGDLLRFIGIKTDICSMNVRQLMIREYYSNDKSRRELGLPQTSIEIAVQEAIDWFKSRGMLKP